MNRGRRHGGLQDVDGGVEALDVADLEDGAPLGGQAG